MVLYDEKTKATALIRSDEHEKLIDIQVEGEQKRDFFAVIRNTFYEIHKSFEKLEITELVPLPDNPKICIEYAELIGYELDGEDKYRVGKLRKVYSVSKLLNGIERPEVRQKEAGITNNFYNSRPNLNQKNEVDMSTITQNVTNSTVHGSVVAAERIENSFSALQESKALIAESSREQPRKRWYEASLSGILEAAKAIGGEAVDVLKVAEKLSPLLLGM